MHNYDWTKSTHYSIDPLPDIEPSMLNFRRHRPLCQKGLSRASI